MSGNDGWVERSSAGRGRNSRGGAVSLSELSAQKTRRNFLRGALYTVGGAIALKFLGKGGNGQQAEGAKLSSGVSSVQVDTIQKDSNIKSEAVSDAEILRKAYQYSHSSDLGGEINAARARMKNLTSDVFGKVGKLEGKIRAYAKGLPPAVCELLIGLVIQESSGDPKRDSYDDSGRIVARGLVQITDDKAKDLNIAITNDEFDPRYDVDVVLPKVVKDLENAYLQFGDWGLAIWQWHRGVHGLQELVRTYIADNFEGEGGVSKNQLAGKLKQYNIDSHKILSYKKIRDSLRNDPRQDNDDEFLYNIATASLEYKNRRV
ncbi:hypothetical protein A2870_01850 [Candidatus Curtissbacteria bacterium RIFCSPHIGHO2_01_FULL_41_11]|uniref:Transglycosylase SLT domain-containing protein n=1 Tax=Candidatus Curtissbacteria bacterium RIFCSPHIGHO2_01_FULL_41_11 TaxID=1797711 RepID=A0A1F5G5E7_9BACT|nr:MAG: hypothetical protein A2870_01850 [Candidatus Curtissbacteria bacterium RIFCSPHIGHO2_01_FULL_41_11]